MAAIELFNPEERRFSKVERTIRDGTELEKGVIITEDWLIKNQQQLLDIWSLYTVYPDIYLDMITPVGSNFKLFPYQRVFLRACMRYTRIYITAARATSKTFLSILAKYLQCVMLPGHVGSIVAPGVAQAAKITKQKVEEIWKIWPLLKNEVELQNGQPHANFGKDYVTIYFKNGSSLSIGAALDSGRGLRTHATLLDEARDLDGDMVNDVIIP